MENRLREPSGRFRKLRKFAHDRRGRLPYCEKRVDDGEKAVDGWKKRVGR